jgi:hypothetical protein
MTRPKNPAAAENESRLQKAIAAVKRKEHRCYSAAKVFGVPPRTLYDRVNGGKKPRNQAHKCDQNLTHAEEKELVRWITLLTISGYPPRYETLRRLAEILRELGRVKKTDGNQVPVIVYDKIGKDWVQRFLGRHPELASVRPRSIDAVRVKDTSPEELKKWFDGLEKVLAEFNIKFENIYNMDESGFAIGERNLGGVSSRPKSVNNSKQSLGVRSESQWWNAFVPKEPSFLLWSFSKRKNCQKNGFRRVFMVDGGSVVTQKDGQAMNTVWIGF